MESLKLPELRAKCISYGLKKSGNKPDLIQRILDHEKSFTAECVQKAVEIEKELLTSSDSGEILEFINVKQSIDNLLSNEMSSQATTSSEHESFQESALDKKRFRTTYTKSDSFATHIDAIAVIKDEFDRERLMDTKDGQKERWTCKHFGCPKKCYILFTLHDESVSLWHNDQEHFHEDSKIKDKFGIQPITKEIIDKLFRQGTKAPKQVLGVLRKCSEREIKDSHNKLVENPDFVPGLVLPTSLQIRNYIANTLKPKEVLTHFNYSDLAKWINEHKDVPESEDEPYVIDSYINVNDLSPKGSQSK